jgi:hypothetical protein
MQMISKRIFGFSAVAGLLIIAAPSERAMALSLINPGAVAAQEEPGKLTTLASALLAPPSLASLVSAVRFEPPRLRSMSAPLRLRRCCCRSAKKRAGGEKRRQLLMQRMIGSMQTSVGMRSE